MPFSAALVGRQLPERPGSWTSSDCLLYALGVGAGAADPGRELEFTTENSTGVRQRVLPTFAVVEGCRVGVGGAMTALADVDLAQLLHGSQSVQLHRSLPVAADVVTSGLITAVWDKGSATVVETESSTRDAASGELLSTCRQSLFFRGTGGWGGERGPATKPAAGADRPPDVVTQLPTRIEQALLYRLSGDRNPLHSDPQFAARAGFDRPILHGLCVFGMAARMLIGSALGGDVDAFAAMSARFARPVLPGDELRLSAWRRDSGYDFVVNNAAGDSVLVGGELSTAGDIAAAEEPQLPQARATA